LFFLFSSLLAFRAEEIKMLKRQIRTRKKMAVTTAGVLMGLSLAGVGVISKAGRADKSQELREAIDGGRAGTSSCSWEMAWATRR
jgi:hypothetical protein